MNQKKVPEHSPVPECRAQWATAGLDLGLMCAPPVGALCNDCVTAQTHTEGWSSGGEALVHVDMLELLDQGLCLLSSLCPPAVPSALKGSFLYRGHYIGAVRIAGRDWLL